MESSLDAYRDLIETTKRLHADIADRLARRPQLIALDPKAHALLYCDGAFVHGELLKKALQAA